MDGQFRLDATQLGIGASYADLLSDLIIRWRFRTHANILVVVDTEIDTAPGQGFGVGSVIEHVRGSRIGCMRFNLDIAERSSGTPQEASNPGQFQARYTGFRFDMQVDGKLVINRYDQIWCFGFKPNNFGSSNDDVIDQPQFLPASDAELAVLTDWMDTRKGGLFGTGDHHFLGASMCRRVPRLGTMRRWTNADGVPPVGTPDRIDTLRPPNADYEPGAPGGPLPLANNPHQGDLTVQPVKWRTWDSVTWPFIQRRRPHPVLCHPTLGPIDVMPDHAHEGLCVPTGEIDLQATLPFAGNRPEYPDGVGGAVKPVPQIIADGSTLESPPYNFDKGAQPYRSAFPMISVYDGHQAGVGRVATDSTWHHWMDINVGDIKAANTEDWQKISRYFVNLAAWLNPPGLVFHCFYLDMLLSHFRAVGWQEYTPNETRLNLGAQLRLDLSRVYGPCWVFQIIRDLVWEEMRFPFEFIRREPFPSDVAGVDVQVFENEILGDFVRRTSDFAEAVRVGVEDAGSRDAVLKALASDDLLARPEEMLAKCARRGVKRSAKRIRRQAKQIRTIMQDAMDDA